MVAEAGSMVDKAKAYREEMDKLPEQDARRAIYEHVIRFLLSRSRGLSQKVIALANG